MSGGWQVGDLALCVDASPCLVTRYQPNLIEGQTYRIVGAGQITCGRTGLTAFALKVDDEISWNVPSRFRKIKPDAEPCKEEFTVLIKRMKPAKVKS